MLLILAALFAAPLAISFLMYYGHSGLQPSKRVNHGDLLDPTVPLPAISLPFAASGSARPDFLRHKWTLLFVGEGSCNERCRKALYDTRQVRIALDRDMVRVQRVFIATSGCCDLQFLQREHPDLIVVRADGAAEPLLEKLRSASRESVPWSPKPMALELSGRVYLVDPFGNLVMSYAPDAPAKGLLEDLKRLLKLSQIG
jgi:hypothetical protein